MQEIPRAILLPPPSQSFQRASARAVQADSDSISETAHDGRQRSRGAAQAFLTLIKARREDTVEIRGKQFRFRPYTSRGAAEGGPPAPDPARDSIRAEANGADAGGPADVFDGFEAGAHARNSSAFIASFIAQERLRDGLHDPQFEAASDAYRRAGGSPSAIDNQPRVLSVAV